MENQKMTSRTPTTQNLLLKITLKIDNHRQNI